MNRLPKKLHDKLTARAASNALRSLSQEITLVDFSSNDYLGFARSKRIYEQSNHYLKAEGLQVNGATGSRLLSGNHPLYDRVEQELCAIYNSESAIIYNSGYSANIGFFSSVPQRGDRIFYDELIHASIRDGIRLTKAQSYKFKHNDLRDLEENFKKIGDGITTYCVTESVFSMDGDSPDIRAMSELCERYNVALVIDEAHAVGILGDQGQGLVSQLGLEDKIFARIHTFGKAFGGHGAVILGVKELKSYLVNFSRSFIYTTGLPPHTLATIHASLDHFHQAAGKTQLQKLKEVIAHFKSEVRRLNLKFIVSDSAIQSCILVGNDRVKLVAAGLQKHGYNVKPILSPTVAQGQERLRFCLHAYNSREEITDVLEKLATFATV